MDSIQSEMFSEVGDVSLTNNRLKESSSRRVLWKVPWFHVRSFDEIKMQSPVFTFGTRPLRFQILKTSYMDYVKVHLLILERTVPSQFVYRIRLDVIAYDEDYYDEGTFILSKESEIVFGEISTTFRFICARQISICAVITELPNQADLRPSADTLSSGSDEEDENAGNEEVNGEELESADEEENGEEAEEETESSDESERERTSPRSRSASKLIEDFRNGFLSGSDTDVVLKVRDKEFRAHRCILGMRSPVFSAMFRHDTAEKRSGVVDIEDCDSGTFSDFLHYTYTGTVENFTSDKAPFLYRTADKYELLELKEECLQKMKDDITVENFCDVLAVSVQHSERELIELAIQFFIEKAADIVLTMKWQDFLVEHPLTGNELFVKLTRSYRR